LKATDFIPHPETGFQVKVPDMPPAKILKEMRPKESIRPVIANPVDRGCAYIIVTPSATALNIGNNLNLSHPTISCTSANHGVCTTA
jgi:hypothetical protein